MCTHTNQIPSEICHLFGVRVFVWHHRRTPNTHIHIKYSFVLIGANQTDPRYTINVTHKWHRTAHSIVYSLHDTQTSRCFYIRSSVGRILVKQIWIYCSSYSLWSLLTLSLSCFIAVIRSMRLLCCDVSFSILLLTHSSHNNYRLGAASNVNCTAGMFFSSLHQTAAVDTL